MPDSNVNSYPGMPTRHEYYDELCSLATSGTLTDKEWTALKEHLAQCAECAQAVRQYREVARTGMAMLMPDSPVEEPTLQASWTPETVKKELFRRIAMGEDSAERRRDAYSTPRPSLVYSWRRLFAISSHPAIGYAALLILCTVTGLYSYRMGVSITLQSADAKILSTSSEVNSLQAQLTNSNNERVVLSKRLGELTGQRQDDLNQLRSQSAAAKKWKALQTVTASGLAQQVAAAAKLQMELKQVIAERGAIGHKFQESQESLKLVQQRYDALLAQRSNALFHTASLETRITDLTNRVKEQDATVREQRKLLAYDRDIRDLMGARKLYIADVYDVKRTGEPRKPYGRVFYTAGRSLIFYAFDLDQQPRLRDASIFQAWGRRGIGDRHPINMGIFYLDSRSNRRWVLKFDNPKALAQIDAVFVTVEPPGGSRKPSGKHLLFASLRTVASNHP